MLIYDQFGIIHNLQMSPIPQISFLEGTSYSKPALGLPLFFILIHYEVFGNLLDVRPKISVENSSTDDTDTLPGCVLVRHYSMEQSS